MCHEIKTMNVFYARSAVDFGTDYEKYWMGSILRALQDKEVKIIELPKDIPKIPFYGNVLYMWEKQELFPLIKKSDLVFAVPSENVKYAKYRGKFGAGVVLEIAYALKIEKPVVGIVNGHAKRLIWSDIAEYRENKNILLTLETLEDDFEYEKGDKL